MRSLCLRLAALVLCAPLLGPGTETAAAREPPKLGECKAHAAGELKSRLSDFSGMPVPRYSSLRYDKVNGRAGPSLDYPVEWSYERQGLPVVIIRESQEWRKIRDPMGDEVWVNKSQLAAERTAMTTRPGAIHRQPDRRSGVVASYLAGGVVALGRCELGWCVVEAEGREGWVGQADLWGADDLGGLAGHP